MIRLGMMLLTILVLTFLSPLNNSHPVLDATMILHNPESSRAIGQAMGSSLISAASNEVGRGLAAVGSMARPEFVQKPEIIQKPETAQKSDPARMAALRPSIDPPRAPPRPIELR